MTQLAQIILAAGTGTRMKPDLPKVLYPVAGHGADMVERTVTAHDADVPGHGLAIAARSRQETRPWQCARRREALLARKATQT